MRCGAYKLHFVTEDSIGPRRFTPIFHDPPLIYNIEHDPSEAYPLAPSSDEYRRERARLETSAAKHEATIAYVPNQMTLGVDPQYKICCDPHSQRVLPSYPACTCDPSNFHTFVCGPVGPVVEMAHVDPTGHTHGALRDVEEPEGVAEPSAMASLVHTPATRVRTMANTVEPSDASTWPWQPRILFQPA